MMKYNINNILKTIELLSEGMEPVKIMEVCGTHTSSIHRFGISDLLPENIRLVSGPGCPVCVTAQKDIASALGVAGRDDVIFTCFGDMLRVPCGDTSLYSLYESGKDIRIVTSPMDALGIARRNPDRHIVYFGIGFETTAPLTAALIEAAASNGVKNLSVLSAHKTMPAAIRQLLGQGSNIDALLCPGHVAAITGADAFSFVPNELGLPAAVAGFEAYYILSALLVLVKMLKSGEIRCLNMYPRAVTAQENQTALSLINKIFRPSDVTWRGLGTIAGSGLGIREYYSFYDTAERFEISQPELPEAEGCLCARILCGKSTPLDCPNFAKTCTPGSPLGACMVSSEGSCAAYYRYKGDK